jgi:hypothetical protein
MGRKTDPHLEAGKETLEVGHGPSRRRGARGKRT